MNIGGARRIRIVECPRIIGHGHVIVRRDRRRRLSPLRKEKEPSRFHNGMAHPQAVRFNRRIYISNTRPL